MRHTTWQRPGWDWQQDPMGRTRTRWLGLARMGTALVAIPTHDWAAYTAPHIRHLRLRAAEHRLAIVKADWRYGSVVIGPDGQVVAGHVAGSGREGAAGCRCAPGFTRHALHGDRRLVRRVVAGRSGGHAGGNRCSGRARSSCQRRPAGTTDAPQLNASNPTMARIRVTTAGCHPRSSSVPV